jgi:hypothetical protein
MALHELHPFSDGEIANLPQKPGVYVFFQIEVAVHVDGAQHLRRELLRAKAQLPAATHFAVEMADGNGQGMARRVQQLREQLRLVRTVGFVGTRSGQPSAFSDQPSGKTSTRRRPVVRRTKA